MAMDAAAIESRRRIGLLIMLASAAVFSTAGLFTKGVAADAWSVIFWRGLFATAFTIAYVLWQGKTGEEFHKMGRPGLAVALLGASGTAAFISAFKLTTIANVSLIYAAAPFFAAGIAWLWFKEVIERRVLIAAIVAMLGVSLIVGGSLGRVNFERRHAGIVDDAHDVGGDGHLSALPGNASRRSERALIGFSASRGADLRRSIRCFAA